MQYRQDDSDSGGKRLMLRRALVAVAPIVPVYLALGGLLGLFMNQAGISSWNSWLNSVLVFAGASQFAMMDMLQSGATAPIIILLTFIINLRHSLMVAAIAPWLQNLRPSLAYFSVFFLTDEAWAVSIREMRTGRSNIVFFLAAALSLYVCWTSATLLGWHFGELLPASELFSTSVRFISLAFFVAILGLLYDAGSGQLLPWLLAAVLSVLLYHFVTQTWHILLAGVLAAAAGVLLRKGEDTADDDVA